MTTGLHSSISDHSLPDASVPAPAAVATTFADLRLAEPLLRAVTAEGYSTPTPIQAQAIPHRPGRARPARLRADRHGQDGGVRAAASSIAWPRRHARPATAARRVLVLAPTRELALQIGESFRDLRRATSG